MKLLIGDIHGRNSWKQIVNDNPSAKTVIFFGDYFDSKDKISGTTQIDNFLEIIDFKKGASKNIKVVLLFGNHDYHYMPWHSREPYSGFQKSYARKIQKLLVENFHDFKMSYSFENVLCSHAGISSIWLNRNIGKEKDGVWCREDLKGIVKSVNQLFSDDPKKFDSQGFESSGNEPQQTPIWIRPWALVESNKGILDQHAIQVFGHTQIKDINVTIDLIQNSWGNGYYPVDSLNLGIYWKWEAGKIQHSINEHKKFIS